MSSSSDDTKVPEFTDPVAARTRSASRQQGRTSSLNSESGSSGSAKPKTNKKKQSKNSDSKKESKQKNTGRRKSQIPAQPVFDDGSAGGSEDSELNPNESIESQVVPNVSSEQLVVPQSFGPSENDKRKRKPKISKEHQTLVEEEEAKRRKRRRINEPSIQDQENEENKSELSDLIQTEEDEKREPENIERSPDSEIVDRDVQLNELNELPNSPEGPDSSDSGGDESLGLPKQRDAREVIDITGDDTDTNLPESQEDEKVFELPPQPQPQPPVLGPLASISSSASPASSASSLPSLPLPPESSSPASSLPSLPSSLPSSVSRLSGERKRERKSEQLSDSRSSLPYVDFSVSFDRMAPPSASSSGPSGPSEPSGDSKGSDFSDLNLSFLNDNTKQLWRNIETKLQALEHNIGQLASFFKQDFNMSQSMYGAYNELKNQYNSVSAELQNLRQQLHEFQSELSNQQQGFDVSNEQWEQKLADFESKHQDEIGSQMTRLLQMFGNQLDHLNEKVNSYLTQITTWQNLMHQFNVPDQYTSEQSVQQLMTNYYGVWLVNLIEAVIIGRIKQHNYLDQTILNDYIFTGPLYGVYHSQQKILQAQKALHLADQDVVLDSKLASLESVRQIIESRKNEYLTMASEQVQEDWKAEILPVYLRLRQFETQNPVYALGQANLDNPANNLALDVKINPVVFAQPDLKIDDQTRQDWMTQIQTWSVQANRIFQTQSDHWRQHYFDRASRTVPLNDQPGQKINAQTALLQLQTVLYNWFQSKQITVYQVTVQSTSESKESKESKAESSNEFQAERNPWTVSILRNNSNISTETFLVDTIGSDLKTHADSFDMEPLGVLFNDDLKNPVNRSDEITPVLASKVNYLFKFQLPDSSSRWFVTSVKLKQIIQLQQSPVDGMPYMPVAGEPVEANETETRGFSFPYVTEVRERAEEKNWLVQMQTCILGTLISSYVTFGAFNMASIPPHVLFDSKNLWAYPGVIQYLLGTCSLQRGFDDQTVIDLVQSQNTTENQKSEQLLRFQQQGSYYQASISEDQLGLSNMSDMSGPNSQALLIRLLPVIGEMQLWLGRLIFEYK